VRRLPREENSVADERREDDERLEGSTGATPGEGTSKPDEEALSDTTDENDMPVDNPSG
jgi:hypothetical protein